MKYEIIKKYAEEFTGLINVLCRRVEIAGSIRRKNPDCKDIEIVCIPDRYLLEQQLNRMKNHGEIIMIKNGSLYKQFKWKSTKIDLFIADAKNWGWALFYRTGSKDWNRRAIATYRKIYKFSSERNPDGTYKYPASLNGHLLDAEGRRVDTCEEQDIFDLLNANFVEPERRL